MDSSSAASPLPLTIHACRGKFLVWHENVCLELAHKYRIIGEWTGRLNATAIAQATAAQFATSTAVAASTSAPSPTPSTILDPFRCEILPMILQPYQVLFLLRHTPSTLHLIDANSIRALRALHTDDTRSAFIRERMTFFKHTLDSHAAHSQKMKEKYAHLKGAKRKDKTNAKSNAGADASIAATAATVNDEETKMDESEEKTNESTTADAKTEETSEVIEPNPKRQKLQATSSPAATASAASTDPLVAEALIVEDADAPRTIDEIASIDKHKHAHLPRLSSYNLALCAVPVTRSVATAHTKQQPTLVSTQLQSHELVVMPRAVNALEFQNCLVHKQTSEKRLTEEQMEQLLFQGICDSFGIQLPTDGTSMTNFLTSHAFTNFLSHYITFHHLHTDRFYILPGIHFGSDMVCYEDAPSKVHSSYLVKVRERILYEDEERKGMEELEVGNMSRMATGINKVVLAAQAILPLSARDTNSSSSSSSVSTTLASSPLIAFRAAIDRIHTARLEASTFQWTLATGIKHTAYPNDEIRRAAHKVKTVGEDDGEDPNANATDE